MMSHRRNGDEIGCSSVNDMISAVSFLGWLKHHAIQYLGR